MRRTTMIAVLRARGSDAVTIALYFRAIFCSMHAACCAVWCKWLAWY